MGTGDGTAADGSAAVGAGNEGATDGTAAAEQAPMRMVAAKAAPRTLPRIMAVKPSTPVDGGPSRDVAGGRPTRTVPGAFCGTSFRDPLVACGRVSRRAG